VSLSEADRAKILALATDLPQLWRATTMTTAERKQIVRLLVKGGARSAPRAWPGVGPDRVADRRSNRASVAAAGAGLCHADLKRLDKRLRDLNNAGNMDHEIATILNSEGLATARGLPFSGEVVHLLRKRWEIATVNQRQRLQPSALARRQLFRAGSGRDVGYRRPDRVQVDAAGTVDGEAAGQRPALADHAIGSRARRAPRPRATHQSLEE